MLNTFNNLYVMYWFHIYICVHIGLLSLYLDHYYAYRSDSLYHWKHKTSKKNLWVVARNRSVTGKLAEGKNCENTANCRLQFFKCKKKW